MPWDIDQEGDNPFFSGHRQKDNLQDSGQYPTNVNRVMQPPGNALDKTILIMAPMISHHHRDIVKKKIEQDDEALKSMGTSGFPKHLNRVIKDVMLPKRVVEAFLRSS